MGLFTKETKELVPGTPVKRIRTWIPGAGGLLSATVTLPPLPSGGRIKMAVLMHGFMANKHMFPIKDLADRLAGAGMASLAFDFNGHGRSYGRFRDMTIPNEVEDAVKVCEYIEGLQFVDGIMLVGHSQGGVVASLCAARLGERISGAVLLAPAAVAHDDALNGCIMNGKFDPKNPPEIVRVMLHPLGRNYILEAQKLDIYSEVSAFKGPMCIIHGKKDTIVPYSYSERYHKACPQSELHLLENESHILNGDRRLISNLVFDFLTGA
ncbi:MAG: alpha/beta hydrolase family protein [Candidatus Cryptobacteroides sp.]